MSPLRSNNTCMLVPFLGGGTNLVIVLEYLEIFRKIQASPHVDREHVILSVLLRPCTAVHLTLSFSPCRPLPVLSHPWRGAGAVWADGKSPSFLQLPPHNCSCSLAVMGPVYLVPVQHTCPLLSPGAR